MAGKKLPKMGIAIVKLAPNPIDAIADVVIATAAIYACEHYDEFDKWVKEEMDKTGVDHEVISKQMLMEAINRVVRRCPEEI